MLATPDDISNLNLNNLAGSALGLWDHARAFLLSFPRSLFLSVAFYRSSVSPSFSRGDLFLSLLRARRARWLTLAHANPAYVTYKVVTSRRRKREREKEGRGGRRRVTVSVLILNWSNIYNIVQSRRPRQISPGGQTGGSAAILKNIGPSEMFAFLWFFTPAHFFSRAFFALWPRHGLIKVYSARVDKYLAPRNFAARW